MKHDIHSPTGPHALIPSSVSFRPSYAHGCAHVYYKCRTGVSSRTLGGKTLLRLSLMYSKVCASNESPPLAKAIV